MVTNLHILIAHILDPLYVLFIKDPCKKCIVKACCTDPCEVVVVLKNYIFPFDTLAEKKKMAWICVIGSTVSIGGVLAVFAKTVM